MQITLILGDGHRLLFTVNTDIHSGGASKASKLWNVNCTDTINSKSQFK